MSDFGLTKTKLQLLSSFSTITFPLVFISICYPPYCESHNPNPPHFLIKFSSSKNFPHFLNKISPIKNSYFSHQIIIHQNLVIFNFPPPNSPYYLIKISFTNTNQQIQKLRNDLAFLYYMALLTMVFLQVAFYQSGLFADGLFAV